MFHHSIFGHHKRHEHAGRGRKFTFHGAFKSKEKAKRKEREVHGFIEERSIKGHRRFVVMRPR